VEPPSSGKKAPSKDPDKLRVLVVDDDPGVRDVAVRLLEFEGVRATSVASGQEALALLDSESFDCVLLDLTMPRFSGRDTFRALRKSNLELPVVFASGQRDDSVDALVVAGSNAYFLDKPFTPRRLLDAIALACKR
jgi:CheY-like chemotaxis protein